MPPKGSKKAPKPDASTPPATPTKSSTPRKTKEPIVFSPLKEAGDNAPPIMVKFEGSQIHSKSIKDGVYSHTIKLQAPGDFSLLHTVVPQSGEYEGKQIIVLQPAKTFPFLKLDGSIRQRVYNFYLTPKDGDVNSGILVDGKRTGSKDIYAKAFADGNKNRVALLAVNREIHTEAVPLLYNRQLRFESTATLLEFLGGLESQARGRLMDIYVKAYSKSTAKTAINLLAEATQLETFHINTGVLSEADTGKAAKLFWGDASKLLIALSTAKASSEAAVDVLSFGRSAFTYKDDKKNNRNWSDEQVEDFRDNLHAKLK